MLLTLLSPQTAPATTSAILIGSSNNPSYRSGFYSPRRGGTPKYPSLWDGCVGAWAPSLGATGLTLRDESVFGNHGTLTDMDAATDWVVSGGKGALRNVGALPSYEHVAITHNLPTVTSATFSIWLRSDGTVDNGAWSINPASALNHYPFSGLIYDSTLNGGVRLAITPLSGIDFAQWHNYTVVRKENESWKAFQNGIEIHSTTPSSSISWLSTFRFLQSIRDDLSTWGFSGDVDDIRIYNRALTSSEIKLLATRRGIAFESKRRLAVRSGAASPSGTLAKTLDSVTLTSSGTLSAGASGSLSSTLADATLSATGTLASGLTGSVSVTLGACVVSATGTLTAGATGSVSSTLADATLSATGTLVTPSTLSAILIGSSNNPSYRSGFYSPRRGGTPKYPSLWDGCVGAWAPSLGATGLTLRDESVFGNHGTLTDMDPATDWVVSGGRGALDFDGADDYVTTTLSNALLPTESFTIATWIRLATTSGRRDFIGRWRNTGLGGNNDWFSYVLLCNTTANKWSFFTQNGGGNFPEARSLSNISTDWTHVCGVYGSGSMYLFVNGVLEATTTAAVPNNLNTTVDFRLGHGDSSNYLSGQLDDIRIYNRALSPSEIKLLSLRRGVAYESKRRLAVRSGAAIPSGTLAKTLDSVTLTSSGTLSGAATGSLSSTLADATLSSSGTLASGLTGTVSVTLADATLSANGTLTNAATGSVLSTLADATLSATGTLAAGASGTVSHTLHAATLSSSGTIGSGLTGSVSASLGAATLVSSGTVAAGATGSVTRTLDNATLSSTGGAAGTVTGSVSSTLAAATCSSSGTLAAGLSGTVTRTLDAVTSSATGTLTNGASGTVTRTLADATLASGGSLSAGLTAQVNRALESCVVSSSGTLASGLTGTLSVQLAAATLQSGNVAVGGLRIKVGGEWKNANAFVKVTGTWRTATPYVKVSGVWKQ